MQHYLHEDSERGWSGTMSSRPAVVTIEDLPYHACAVRQMLKPTPGFPGVYQRTVATRAVNNKIGPLQSGPPIQQTRNGTTINALGQMVPGPNGHPTQGFMYLVATT
jgi:hypothetical protein